MSSRTERTPTDEPRAARRLRDWHVPLAIFFVYVLTRYPAAGGRINMGDSAKFQFIGRLLGVGHAPGNPLYLIANALWVRIPLPLTDATKITLLSGVFGFITLLLVTRTVALFDRPPVLTLTRPFAFVLKTPMFTAILLGLGALFWTFSTEAEVYTLGTIFLAGVMLGLARFTIRGDRSGLFLAVACLVLGVANHLTIVALIPGLVFVVVRTKEGRAELKRPALWLVVIGAAAVTMLAYGYIAWRWSKQPLEYSEIPRQYALNLENFLDFITARTAREKTFSRTNFSAAMFERMPDLFARLQSQWLWPALLLLPLGAWRLARMRSAFFTFVMLSVTSHFIIAALFRIPDPEGLFLSVVVLLVIPLGLVPDAVGLLKTDDADPSDEESSLQPHRRSASVITGPRVAATMLALHLVLVGAHVLAWMKYPHSAYMLQTPDGQVVVSFPTLADVVPEHAMVAVPCGHYGCVEVTNYYRYSDEKLRDKDVTFVRFPWSEWDERISIVPVIDPNERGGRTRPLCVLLGGDVKKLKDLGLITKPIPRPPVEVLGRTYIASPLECLGPD